MYRWLAKNNPSNPVVEKLQAAGFLINFKGTLTGVIEGNLRGTLKGTLKGTLIGKVVVSKPETPIPLVIKEYIDHMAVPGMI